MTYSGFTERERGKKQPGKGKQQGLRNILRMLFVLYYWHTSIEREYISVVCIVLFEPNLTMTAVVVGYLTARITVCKHRVA